MNIAIVTDEISSDVSESIQLARQWGVVRFELRGIGDARVPDVDEATVQTLLQWKNEVTFTSLSPGNYKLPLCHPDLALHRGLRLRNAIKLAHRLDIGKMILFGIQRDITDTEASYSQVVDILGESARVLHEEGIVALLENEPGWWPDTVENTRRLLQDLSGSHMMLNWDPGNFYSANETDFGFAILREWIAHIHMKDYHQTQGVPLGEGDMDWQTIVTQLHASGYDGEWMIETHCRPGPEMSRRCIQWLKKAEEGLH